MKHNLNLILSFMDEIESLNDEFINTNFSDKTALLTNIDKRKILYNIMKDNLYKMADIIENEQDILINLSKLEELNYDEYRS